MRPFSHRHTHSWTHARIDRCRSVKGVPPPRGKRTRRGVIEKETEKAKHITPKQSNQETLSQWRRAVFRMETSGFEPVTVDTFRVVLLILRMCYFTGIIFIIFIFLIIVLKTVLFKRVVLLQGEMGLTVILSRILASHSLIQPILLF